MTNRLADAEAQHVRDVRSEELSHGGQWPCVAECLAQRCGGHGDLFTVGEEGQWGHLSGEYRVQLAVLIHGGDEGGDGFLVPLRIAHALEAALRGRRSRKRELCNQCGYDHDR